MSLIMNMLSGFFYLYVIPQLNQKLMRQLLFLLGFACWLSNISFAQSYLEVFRLDYTSSPVFDDKDAVNNIQRWSGNINFASPIQPDKLLFLANYEGKALSFNLKNTTLNNLYSNKLALGTVHLWDDKKWRLILLLHTKINSDYKDITFDQDFQFGGSALLTFTKSEDLAFSAGGYFNSEYFGPFFIPLAGISWQASKLVFIYALVPQQVRVEYALKPSKLYTGLQGLFSVSTYRLNETQQNNYIEERTIDINAFLDFYITKNLVLFAQTGLPLRLQYQYYTKDDSELFDAAFPFRSRADMNIKAGIAFQIRQKN